MKLLARIEELMAGDDLAGSAVILVEGPQKEWEMLEVHGRPAGWHLDEFAAHLVVVLAERRWPGFLARFDGELVGLEADPYRQVFIFGAQLLRATGILPRQAGGREIPVQEHRDDLRQRFWRARKKGDLPLPPDDDDPLGWIEAVERRLLEGAAAPDRRRFIAPTDPSRLPDVMHATILLPGQREVAWTCRWFYPLSLERLRQIFPDPVDLVIALAVTGVNAIAKPRGIRERLLEALGEPPAGSPPEPDPSADASK